MTDRKKVFVAIPAFESQIHVDLARSLFAWGTQYKIDLAFACGATPLHAARNILVEQFLKTDAEYIFFVDDDVIPPFDALEELIIADKDIIMPGTMMIKPIGGGAMAPVPQCMRKHNPEKEGYMPCWGEGIEEVDTIGGAAFLVKRHVFESEPYQFRFEYYPNGKRKKGADIAFSEDMRARGHKLFVHFDVPCRHVRPVDLLKVHYALQKLNKEDKHGNYNSISNTECDS